MKDNLINRFNVRRTHTQTHTSLLWMSICSLDFVVFEGAVLVVAGEAVEDCIFSNNLHRQQTNKKMKNK